MCVLFVIYPLRANDTHATTPYGIGASTMTNYEIITQRPSPSINYPNYAFQLQRIVDGQDLDRKLPESHANTATDEPQTTTSKSINLQSTGQCWIQ